MASITGTSSALIHHLKLSLHLKTNACRPFVFQTTQLPSLAIFKLPEIHIDARECSTRRIGATTSAEFSATTVLDVVLPLGLSTLIQLLKDPECRFFRTLHQALGGRDFKLVETAADDVLQFSYTTPLPVAGLTAINTETITFEESLDQGNFMLTIEATTQGIPMAGTIRNVLQWRAEVQDNGTRVVVTSVDCCAASALGPLRNRIRKESIKGIRQAYGQLYTILSRACQAGRTTTETLDSFALKSPDDDSRVLLEATSDEEEEEEEAKDSDDLDNNNSPPPNNSNGSNKKKNRPKKTPSEPTATPYYKQLFRQLSGSSIDELTAYVQKHHPQWYRSRFWLITSKGNYVEDAPAPDVAVAVLWAVIAWGWGPGVDGTPKRPARDLPQPNDAFIVGLVECLRLKAPRIPSAVAAHYSRGPRATTAVASNTTRTKLSVEAIPRAFNVLAVIGGANTWKDEMESLCNRLPEVNFKRQKEIYGILWSLRRCRHWTPRLTYLEESSIRLIQKPDIDDTADISEFLSSISHVQKVANIAQALMFFGIQPTRLLELLAPLLKESNISRHVACSLCWTIAISGNLHSPVVEPLMKGLKSLGASFRQQVVENDKGEKQPLFPPGSTSLYPVHQFCCSIRERKNITKRFLQDPDLSFLMSLAEQHGQEAMRSSHILTSAAQKEVYQILASMGYSSLNLETSIQSISVDVSMPRERIAVEVDGPTHFARTKSWLVLGNGLWKKRELEKMGWKLVNINVKKWNKIEGREGKRDFMARRLQFADDN